MRNRVRMGHFQANSSSPKIDFGRLTGILGIADYSSCAFCNVSTYYTLASLILEDCKMPPVFPEFEFEYSGGTCTAPSSSFFEILQFLTGLTFLDVSSNDLSTGIDLLVSVPLLSSFDIRNNSDARKSLFSYTNQQRFSYDPTTNFPFSISMSCVQGAIGRLALQVDPLFFNFENCVCRPGFYGKPPNCRQCLSNAQCSFTNEADIPYENMSLAFRESGNVVARYGYYASPSVSLAEMMQDRSYPTDIEICALAGTDLTPCDANEDGPCKGGYQGRLCSACSSGYFRSGDRCVECPNSAGLVFFAMLIVLASVGLIFWSFFGGSSSSGLVKVLLFFWQALFFTRTPMPSGLYVFSHGASAFITSSLAGPECFFSSWDYTSNYVVSVAAPFISMVLVGLIWIPRWFTLRMASIQKRESWTDRCRRSAIFLFMFFFMSAMSAILASFSCTTDSGDGKSYLLAFPNQECSLTLRSISACLLVLYGLLIPGTMFCFMYRCGVLSKNAKSGTRRMYVYSLLFGSYRSVRRWWELVVILRRILFVAAYVTIRPLSAFRTTLLRLCWVPRQAPRLSRPPTRVAWRTPLKSSLL
eukprot:ANDGO_06887.mRNA.1 Putative leucine-rich repeat-containing protein DDB_G0281931